MWRALHELKAMLKAKFLLATTGNHDIDSRHEYNHYDAKGLLQSLNPRYPFPTDSQNDKYWSRHFAIVAKPDFRILVLNSSAFHGEGRYNDMQRYEYEQGRISDFTLAMLKSELEKTPPAPINVLLCHHHPHQHAELRLSADDLMLGGAELLSLLGSGSHGRWLVVHGHKHHPKLEYASGGSSSPIVFAAGSLAAVLFRELQTATRNQFYILDLPAAQIGTLGFVGRFTSWDWATGHGWLPAGKGSGLPHSGGFGWRGDILLFAENVAAHVQSVSMKWTDITTHFPLLNFVLPQDLIHLLNTLEETHRLTVEPMGELVPVIVGRPQ